MDLVVQQATYTKITSPDRPVAVRYTILRQSRCILYYAGCIPGILYYVRFDYQYTILALTRDFGIGFGCLLTQYSILLSRSRARAAGTVQYTTQYRSPTILRDPQYSPRAILRFDYQYTILALTRCTSVCRCPNGSIIAISPNETICKPACSSSTHRYSCK